MLVEPRSRQYRVRADPTDWRDLIYSPTLQPLKERVDLRPWCSAVEDQGHLGSCVGNAVVGVYELLIKRDAPTRYLELSRLFVYYNGRLIEGTGNQDIGLYVRDGVKSVKQYGICSEHLWPYKIDRFTMTPTVESYEDARTRNIKNYYRVTSLDHMLDALNNLHPVVFGLEVYSGFEKLEISKDYILSMPDPAEQPIGGHAMCMVGYDLPRGLILARNSFGPNWAMNGYCWIPFDYVKQEIFDSWIFEIDLINN